jgi:hypothetical protein
MTKKRTDTPRIWSQHAYSCFPWMYFYGGWRGRERLGSSFVHCVLITNTFLWSTKYHEYFQQGATVQGPVSEVQKDRADPIIWPTSQIGHTGPVGFKDGQRTRSWKATRITVRRVPERNRRTWRRPGAEKYLGLAATQQSTGQRQCV